jgi:hypothetical protein
MSQMTIEHLTKTSTSIMKGVKNLQNWAPSAIHPGTFILPHNVTRNTHEVRNIKCSALSSSIENYGQS